MVAATSGLPGVILIVLTAVLLPGTCIITYVMSTSYGHVEKNLPYISDTGTYPPESGVFGILMTCFALSALVSVYCRWRMLSNHCVGSRGAIYLNNSSFLFGSFAAAGCLLVACFQQTAQMTVHIIGAVMAFSLVCVYMWFQTVLTRILQTVSGYKSWLIWFRLIVAIATTVSFLGTASLTAVAEGKKPENHTMTSEPGSGIWRSSMNGYEFHLASTSFEWAMAGLVSIYFLSFCSEFRFISVGMPSVTILPSSKK